MLKELKILRIEILFERKDRKWLYMTPPPASPHAQENFSTPNCSEELKILFEKLKRLF
jgi:hypothetical protein